MSKFSIGNFIKNSRNLAIKRSPELLVMLGIFGLGSAAYMLTKAVPKALQAIRDEVVEREDLGEQTSVNIEELPTMLPLRDKFRLTWRIYLPAAITGAISMTCIVGASAINYKRNAALAAAYALTETTFADYKNRVIEALGKEKETEIHNQVVKDHMDRQPPGSCEAVVTSGGHDLCYDLHSGRYFYSSKDLIKDAKNEINDMMTRNMYASLNDFYYELGLPPTGEGEMFGWNMNQGFLDITFGTQTAADGRSCTTILYYPAPRYDFAKLM